MSGWVAASNVKVSPDSGSQQKALIMAHRGDNEITGASSLYGRRRECGLLDGLVERVRDGRGAALVLWGDPGVGKTALLDYAVDSAADLQVVRAAGVEAEAELAFAALCQLCRPLLGLLGQLPGPQRAALRTVFGLEAGPGTGSLPGRLGGARPAVRGGRRAPADVRRRRRARA